MLACRARAPALALVLGVPARAPAEPGSLRVGLPALPAKPRSRVRARRTRAAGRPPGLRHAPAVPRRWQRRRAGARRAVVRVERRARLDVPSARGRAVPRRHAADVAARGGQPRAADSTGAPERAGGERRWCRACFAARPGVVKEIRAPDARTVQIALVLPYAPLLTVLAHPALSIVLPSPPGEATAPLLGTGPFCDRRDRAGAHRARGESRALGRRPARRAVSCSSAAPDASQARGGRLDAQALDLFFPAGAPTRLSGAVSGPGLAHRVPRPSDGEGAVQPGEGSPRGRGRARSGVDLARRRSRGGSAPGIRPHERLGPARWRGDPRRQSRAREEALRRGWCSGGRRSPTLLVADGDKRADMVRAARGDPRRPRGGGLRRRGAAGVDRDRAYACCRTASIRWCWWKTRAEAGDPHFLLYPLSTSEGAAQGAAGLEPLLLPEPAPRRSAHPRAASSRSARAPARLRARAGHARGGGAVDPALRALALGGGAARRCGTCACTRAAIHRLDRVARRGARPRLPQPLTQRQARLDLARAAW